MNQFNQTNTKQLITLAGTLKSKAIERTDKNGKRYYFAFLITEEGEKTLFFFDPPYHLMIKIEQLKEDDTITVEGIANNETSLKVSKIVNVLEKEQEIFS